MKPPHRLAAALAAAASLLAASAWAHHSFAMFDRTRSVTINGTINKVEWVNPHIWFWITVPKENGGSEEWPLESGGPSQMTRMGLPRTLFKQGDKITVEVYPMKDGRLGGQFVRATLADGTQIDVGKSSAEFAAGGKD